VVVSGQIPFGNETGSEATHLTKTGRGAFVTLTPAEQSQDPFLQGDRTPISVESRKSERSAIARERERERYRDQHQCVGERK